jgi:GNAT superfamily N-acetyltransferase
VTARAIGPVDVRIGSADDQARARAAYESWGYRGGVQAGDTLFLAEQGGELVGVVRLTLEEGTRMLRGMQVAPHARRRGVGSRLLHALVSCLGGEECYCVPYAHLVGFYGQEGFAVRPLEEAPAFLVRRVADYRRDGLDVTVMRRPGTPVAGDEHGGTAPAPRGRSRDGQADCGMEEA